MTINVGDYILYNTKVWKVTGVNSLIYGINIYGIHSVFNKNEIDKVASGTNRLEPYEREPQYVWTSSAFGHSLRYEFEPVYYEMVNNARVELAQNILPGYEMVWSDDD